MVIKIAVNIKVWILGVINSIDDSAEQSACYEVRRGGEGRKKVARVERNKMMKLYLTAIYNYFRPTCSLGDGSYNSCDINHSGFHSSTPTPPSLPPSPTY
jgi:hypothetical protein